MRTITHGLLKQYLENWEERTLIGRELWDFISDDKNYHIKLIDLLLEAADTVLMSNSIIEEIEEAIRRILDDFYERYENENDKVSSYLDDLW